MSVLYPTARSEDSQNAVLSDADYFLFDPFFVGSPLHRCVEALCTWSLRQQTSM
jgi:hypothetical protein